MLRAIAGTAQLLRARDDAREAFRGGTTVAVSRRMKTLHRVALAGFVAACFSSPAQAAKPPAAGPQPRRAPPAGTIEIWVRGGAA